MPWTRPRLFALTVCLGSVVVVSTGRASVDTPRQPPATLFAVGDIMDCQHPERADAVGRLMERHLDQDPDAIGLTLGDNSQDRGTRDDYQCLDESVWGGLRPRLFPVPGNHDYDEFEATGTVPEFYLWFMNTGRVEDGYYAFTVGAWRVLAINSELMRKVDGALRPRAVDQLAWIERELRQHASSQCVLAYMHRPPFSSGAYASPKYVGPIVTLLYKYGADLVLTGHEHFFADYPPLDPTGRFDPTYGLHVLTAGTGGGRSFPEPRVKKYGETVIADALGILKLELTPGRYDWRFLPVDEHAHGASGKGVCHGNPPGYRG